MENLTIKTESGDIEFRPFDLTTEMEISIRKFGERFTVYVPFNNIDDLRDYLNRECKRVNNHIPHVGKKV